MLKERVQGYDAFLCKLMSLRKFLLVEVAGLVEISLETVNFFWDK